jgi:acyl-CoA dehydrogenase-like protein
VVAKPPNWRASWTTPWSLRPLVCGSARIDAFFSALEIPFPGNGDIIEKSTKQGVFPFLTTALSKTRTGVAWFAVGCQMGAYEHALRYAHERTQFGKPIGGFQLVQDLLVRMLGNVTSCQAMMVRLSQLQDQGLMKDEHASLAKAFTTVKCRETVGYARELLGGNGILLENHVGRFVADAEAIYSYEGTREMNTLIVGKSITVASAPSSKRCSKAAAPKPEASGTTFAAGPSISWSRSRNKRREHIKRIG